MDRYLFLSFILILIISSIWDMCKKTIPNAFVIIGLIIGYIYSFVSDGWHGVLNSSVSMTILFFIGFFILWGIMAAGDVKILIVISLFVGVSATLKVTLLSIFLSSAWFVLRNPKRIHFSVKKIINYVFYTIPLRIYDKKESIAFSPYITLSFLAIHLLF